MKKLQLLFAAMLIGLTSAAASEIVSETKMLSLDKQGEDLTITKRYRYTQPILFVERGVEFLIFPDGSFDFNTEFGNTISGDYYRGTNRTRRSSVNTTYGAPGWHTNYNRPRGGTIVTHDRWGNVRRVGNVFINYDYYGRVKRLGSVYVRYNRRGQLSQVGGLRLIYGRNGRLIRLTGQVNYHNQGCGFCGTTSCSIDHFDQGQGHGGNDWFDDNQGNDDFYYYKQNGKQKKFKRNKSIKRFKNDDDD